MVIDTSFDVRTDAGGRDPDAYSATLRAYHQQLWSRPLPDGTPILVERPSRSYLRMNSPSGSWDLGSDSIIHTYQTWRQTAAVLAQIPDEEVSAFLREGCTVGAYIVFPVAFHAKPTLNQARGIRAVISDRFDLTLECVRRHYRGEVSPLSDVLNAYSEFFEVFGSFDVYVSHFLLQDLIDDKGQVQTFLPFDSFGERPIPHTVDEYREYRDASVRFVRSRNARITQLEAE